MSKDARWLEDVIVLNESRSLDLPGDIGVYRNAGEACSHLEPWWVAASEGYALTGLGDRIVFGVHENRVVVIGRQPEPEGVALLERWLTSAATAVLAARKRRAGSGRVMLSSKEHEGALPKSIEGLVAYVGFDN